MKYKVTIEEITEVDEKVGVYEHKDTYEQRDSVYALVEDEKAKYKFFYRPTGKKILNSETVFSQTTEMPDIKDVIKATNGFLQ